MSSNLTGRYIADSYQYLVQVDYINSASGSTNWGPATVLTSDKTTLVNGLGEKLGTVTIDQTGVSGNNGGLYFKHTTSDPAGVWAIQTPGVEWGGLNFFRAGGSNGGNFKLFLKNTGSTWVGFGDNLTTTLINNLDGTTNVHNLFVKSGIVIAPPDLSAIQITTITSDSSMSQFSMLGSKNRILMNSNESALLVRQDTPSGGLAIRQPIQFLSLRFQVNGPADKDIIVDLKIPSEKYNVGVVGVFMVNAGVQGGDGTSPAVYCFIDDGSWCFRATMKKISQGNNDFNVQAMFVVCHESISSRENSGFPTPVKKGGDVDNISTNWISDWNYVDYDGAANNWVNNDASLYNN